MSPTRDRMSGRVTGSGRMMPYSLRVFSAPMVPLIAFTIYGRPFANIRPTVSFTSFGIDRTYFFYSGVRISIKARQRSPIPSTAGFFKQNIIFSVPCSRLKNVIMTASLFSYGSDFNLKILARIVRKIGFSKHFDISTRALFNVSMRMAAYFGKSYVVSLVVS